MSRGRWTKHNGANSKVLEIIKEIGRHMTTNEIRLKLLDHNVKIAWITLNGYLEDLEKEGILQGLQLKKKNILRIWQIKRG